MATRIAAAATLHQLFEFLCRQGTICVTRTNVLYLVIGALAIAVVAMGYQLYQDRHQPQGVHIDFGPNGLSINGK
jgi:hypothetical protein